MKKTALALLIPALLTACSPCEKPEGEVGTHQLMLDQVNSIQLNTSSKVRLFQGTEQKIEITCPSGVLDNLNQEVQNGFWDINFDPCVQDADDIVFSITLASLEQLGVSGSGTITGNGFFNTDRLDLSVTGSGSVKGTFNANEVTTVLSGSGNITLSGSANHHNVEITGSGELEATEFLTNTSSVSITGSGDAGINVKSSLDGRVTGSGNIYYYGSPASVKTEVTGSGEIVKK